MHRVAVVLTFLVLSGCGGGDASPGAPAPGPAPPAVSGLDLRPSNTSCVAWERPTGTDSITLQRVFPNLSFASPVAMLQAPGDETRWFVVQQAGRVVTFANQASVAVGTTFVDITARVRSGGETGLLGMAFHPGFPADPRVFLSYTTGTSPLVSRISAFTTPDGGATLDPNSERILMTVTQPEANHNGGHIAFGPDGMLYIGLGDGGGGGDQHGTIGNGQLTTTLLGKLLRIDVGSAVATSYSIPAGNPFAGNPSCGNGGSGPQGCPEIHALGFRNPWRFSFDRATGELWAGDVGQNVWEEISLVERGGNYGWRIREGAHCFNPATNCPTAGLIDPVAEYDHSLGNSVTGGYAYRGPQSTALYGRYLFGDFGSGRLWAWLPEAAVQPRQPTQLADTAFNISSFGEGNDGELYVVHYGGTLHRIVFQAATGGGTVPASLSGTGCVQSANAADPASGLLPYAVNAPFWSDGAGKQRFLALPNGLNITVQMDGDWELPAGSVLMKHFRLGTRLVETRLLMRHPDGVWGGYSYEWNAGQTDAIRVQGGAVRDVGGQPWIFPSESQCLECHTAAAGRSLGLETAQLNGSFTYAATGRTANQLATLSSINVLSPPVANPAALPALADPSSPAASLESRARSYLHTNCAQCHRPGGPTPGAMDLRAATSLAGMNACNVAPSGGNLGLQDPRLIAPGNPARSVIVARMNRRDAHGMPPLGSAIVDAAGVTLVSDWIAGLGGC